MLIIGAWRPNLSEIEVLIEFVVFRKTTDERRNERVGCNKCNYSTAIKTSTRSEASPSPGEFKNFKRI